MIASQLPGTTICIALVHSSLNNSISNTSTRMTTEKEIQQQQSNIHSTISLSTSKSFEGARYQVFHLSQGSARLSINIHFPWEHLGWALARQRRLRAQAKISNYSSWVEPRSTIACHWNWGNLEPISAWVSPAPASGQPCQQWEVGLDEYPSLI